MDFELLDVFEDDVEILEILEVGIPRQVYERNEYFYHFDELSFYKRFRLTKEITLLVLEQIECYLESPTNRDGFPSNRFVLLKSITSEGFTFFTNYDSQKAHDILNNPNVAMTIYWCPLRRSVRIEGVAEKISKEDSLAYFRQRPRASQIGALASSQSKVIESRQQLDEIESKIKTEIGTCEVPLPNWGGYLIKPRLVEFWQGQTDRLHDRIRFRRTSKMEHEVDHKLVHCGENGWVYERLAP